MDKGLKCRPIAAFYGIVSVVFLIIFAGVQTNAFSSVASTSFNISPIAIAMCYTLLLVIVIFGGASRIYYYFFSDHIDNPSVKLINIAINVATIMLGFVGPLVSSTTIWNLASALCGLLSLVNLACLALLYKPGVSTLRDYEAQLKHGLDPVFIPERCGIENAELWHRTIAEDYADELKAYKQVFPDK